MAGEEYEKFEITDYDLENEFNMFRPRRKLTKNQQIYGIWADDSDEECKPSSSVSSRSKPKGYTAPIGFVAGGVQQSGKKKEEDEIVKISDDEDDAPLKTGCINSSSESEGELPARPSFGRQTKSTVTEITGDIAGLRKKNHSLNPNFSNQNVGNWEKHTRGIGAKLLLQMGYQPGKGLGKDLQGISAPIEAHVRKGRGAIGAYGPEKKTTVASLKDKTGEVIDIDDVEKTSKWKKDEKEVSAKKRNRYYYKSVDDVIEKGKRPGAYRNAGISSELSKVKVIDMTGPQQRVLSGYHALAGPKAPPGVELYDDVVHKQCANFALPEMQHNLDLLVDMCEQEIILCDRNKRHCEDRLVALRQEENQLKSLLSKESNCIETMENVMGVVHKLMHESEQMSLGQMAQTFKKLKDKYYEEFSLYELGELAPGLVGPLITSALASWSPLNAPDMYTDIFRQWRDILEKPAVFRVNFDASSSYMDPYDSLLWNTWMPVIRECINSWNPRDCNSLIDLISAWEPLLPAWIYSNVLQLVLPVLTTEVSDWNPLIDTIPIHIWIHPWLPILESRLNTVIIPMIQDKLGSALANWHPSDRSAKLMLSPWKNALKDGEFMGFLHKHIVPKLQLCMQNFVINPHQQHLDAWHSVMDWSELIPVSTMAQILDKCFFPRWLQTLSLWLNHCPDYNQVTDWYAGWKRMLSDQLLIQPLIKDHFHKALEMMNRSVSLGQPGAMESVSYLTNMENVSVPPPPPPPKIESLAEAVRTASKIPHGFKDLIAKRCEERGILFMPIPNRYHEAKQVYRIGGSMMCYIDRNVVFACLNGSPFQPIALNKLLDMA